MEEVKLDVHIRKEKGSQTIKKIRHQGYIPAVVYGEDHAPAKLQVDQRQYEKIMRGYKGQSVLFHLNVFEGEKKLRDYSAIVKEEQYDPTRDTLIHLDFQRISLEKEIEVKVPLIVKGEAIGVVKQGGSLDQPLRELSIICLPTDIPKNITVDVSELNIGDAIHVKDIKLPNKVKTKHDLEAIVVSVVASMKEEKVSPPEQMAEPEVIKETKAKPLPEEAKGPEGAEKKESSKEKA